MTGFFALLGSTRVKAARKIFVQSTPAVQKTGLVTILILKATDVVGVTYLTGGGESEIADFDVITSVKKNVRRFQISVKEEKPTISDPCSYTTFIKD